MDNGGFYGRHHFLHGKFLHHISSAEPKAEPEIGKLQTHFFFLNLQMAGRIVQANPNWNLKDMYALISDIKIVARTTDDKEMKHFDCMISADSHAELQICIWCL